MNNFASRLFDEISSDHISGASQLATRSLEGIVEYALSAPAESSENLLSLIHRLADRLSGCRPSMPVIGNQLQRLNSRLDGLRQQPLSSVRSSVAEICRDLLDEHALKIRQTLDNVLDVLVEGETLMTHSDSSLVRQVLLEAATRRISVVVTESRPGGEGQFLAKWLLDRQIPVTMISDSQSMLAMEYVDRVLVGADCVAADGSVINKVGTHSLALACAATRKPLFVIADTLKYSVDKAADIPLEQIATPEPDSGLEDIEAENRWFEVTPAKLITAWVNEHGVQYRWIL